MDHFYVYMLLLDNGHFYTGVARDAAKRFEQHVRGRASRLTRSFKPLAFARCWRLRGGRAQAQKVEAFIKSCPRKRKELFVREPQQLGVWLRQKTGSRIRLTPIEPPGPV